MVQIDMLSKGTIGSNEETSSSARLIETEPPIFGVSSCAAAGDGRLSNDVPESARAPAANPEYLSRLRRVLRHSSHCRSANARSTGVTRVRNSCRGLLSFIVFASSLHGAPFTICGRGVTGCSADHRNLRDDEIRTDCIAVMWFRTSIDATYL